MEMNSLILVVDDQQDAARALQRLLKYRGHEAATANDGYQALEFLNTNKTDLVVLDIMMPGMDGISVLKSIRENPALSETKVIVFSAGDNQQTAKAVAQLGARAFIHKGSISGERLLKQIESHLA